jgi:hypothetical protein
MDKRINAIAVLIYTSNLRNDGQTPVPADEYG